MDFDGKHLVIDAFDCPANILNDLPYLQDLLTKIAQSLNMNVLHTHFHQFHPQGVTGVIVLSTSHIAIHTWPEKNYAALDIYTCGDSDPAQAITALLTGLAAKTAFICTISRGDIEEEIHCQTYKQ